jgi:hypothetical protein
VGFSQTPGRRRKRSTGEIEGALVVSLELNRFLIERRLGSGGFAGVYEA